MRGTPARGRRTREGGKPILLHGAAGELVPGRSTSDCHGRVRDVLGARPTRAFPRYHVPRGTNHANLGAPAFAAAFDSLAAPEHRAEEGQPPARAMVTGTAHHRTRPLCASPARPGIAPETRTALPASAAHAEDGGGSGAEADVGECGRGGEAGRT